MENKKIILGTAQFLNQYGIANINQKKISKNTFYKILNLSLKNGIKILDTANTYNNEKEIDNLEFVKLLRRKAEILGINNEMLKSFLNKFKNVAFLIIL